MMTQRVLVPLAALASVWSAMAFITPTTAPSLQYRTGSLPRLPHTNQLDINKEHLPRTRLQSTISSPVLSQTIAPDDAWVLNLDHEAFKRDVSELGARLERSQGPDDVAHLKKICLWSNAFAVLGLATMWLPPNPISVMALSLWTFSRWTTIAHHTCHGGYNRADKTKYFSSRGFASGSLYKRATQWFDWMLPEAWNIEHNNLHHYRLGEKYDPDLVERNCEYN